MTLGQYLKGVRKASGLKQKNFVQRLGWKAHTVWQLENDKRTLTPNQVQRVALAYSADPLIVLSFLPPPQTGHALLPRDGGFRSLPFVDTRGKDATYKTPVHRLDSSDNFIVFLTLGDGGSSVTPDHHHGGDEIVFVLRGKVRMTLGNLFCDLNEWDVMHFKSDQEHHIENVGTGECEVMIVRQYEV